MSNKDISEKSFNGYETISSERLADIDSTGVILRHKKSGARVALIQNDDRNKVFSIGFRTTPFDSTGVPHIIEHTVLCGSDKYPVKDPFVELAKSSLNTFLNAMTYPDKTIYPVASCNDQDIKNLMGVYMDAVLYPNIYHHEEIFKQEGWHYELDSPEGELRINGVVYNEMKGAFSTPDEVVDEDIMHSILPDTTYGVCSGGDPEVIPTLTYENYLDFHRRYYHPSNSYILLYGDFDFEERLQWLDEEYLSKFVYSPVDSEVKLQKIFSKPRTVRKTYPIGTEEDPAGKTYLSYNVLTGREKIDVKKNIALSILDMVLFGIPGAPVRQALLDANIGKNILHGFNSYIRQPYFDVTASFAEADQLDEFVRIIESELGRIADEGVNKDSLLAAINSMEFSFRESDTGNTPKGLILGVNMLETWLYDEEDPFANIKLLGIYSELKNEIESGYFEKLIREELLDNPHKLILISTPEPGLTEKREEALRQKLAAYKAGLSADEISDLIEKTKALTAYQEAEDTPEALATLPVLKVSDVEKKALEPVNEEREIAGSRVIYHDIATNGICYARLYFDASDIDVRFAPYLSLLSDILVSISTEKYSYLELANAIGINTGGLWIENELIGSVKDSESFLSLLAVKFKSLPENIGKSLELALEIITCSRIDDKKRLKEVVGELFTSRQNRLIGNGHQTAMERAASYFSSYAAYDQEISGIEYYNFLKNLYENFDELADETIDRLRYVTDTLIRSDNFIVSLTGKEKEYEIFAEKLAEFKSALSAKEKALSEIKKPEIGTPAYEKERRNEAFRVSGQVQYCATSGSFKNAGIDYSGAFAVLKTIMGYDYLWMNLRVKGGAYGCFFSYRKLTGVCSMVSYRDPNLAATYDVFKNAADYISNSDFTQEEIDKYIIGTLSNTDMPMLPRAFGDHSFNSYMAGITYEMLQKERDEILGATPEVIRGLGGVLSAAADQGYICTVGSAGKINEDAALFENIRDLN